MPSLLQQFRSFHTRNFPNSLEESIDYFSVFGGLGWEIDTDVPLTELIQELILENYGHLHNQVSFYTLDDPLYHTILTAISRGDRRTHSAYKRAHISQSVGDAAVEYLCRSGILKMEYSREVPPQREYPHQKLKKEVERHQISDKLLFTSPFLRFWFAFVAPLHKSIKNGDYTQLLLRFQEHEQSFSSLLFEKLSIAFLKKHCVDDPIIEVGSYWDRQVEIDVLAKTHSGLNLVAECKYTNTKVNRSEWGKLQEKCQLADLQADINILFSKRGFSNELLALADKSLLLYQLNDFKILLENISPYELIEGFEKP